MTADSAFFYIGMAACIGASLYMLSSGQKVSGLLFLFGFSFQLQASLYMYLVGHPEGTGACWATVQDYYSCLPVSAKISMHIGQLGPFFIAAAVMSVVRSFRSSVHGT